MSQTTEINKLVKIFPRRYRTLATLVITLVVIGISLFLASTNQSSVPAFDTSTISTSQYAVVDVVDGDTVKLEIDNKIQTARLIGINTPETVDPNKPVECYGKEASNKLKQLLDGTQVYVASDPTQDTKDKYGRLLLYIWLSKSDGTKEFINEEMVADGYAHEYTYDKPYEYQTEFRQMEAAAKQALKGLWGSCLQI